MTASKRRPENSTPSSERYPTLPRTNSPPGTASRNPVERSSSTTTSAPVSSSIFTMCEPM
ncbi:MAG: hypothetical protein A3G83_10040 [Betaproteobacteria bacterium RIFCSPLOWO2_12_FULL_68_20]|nr:MAG: hypothetical protein A3G83_10040 [Betaproteobacteria bacterium RIFCSPLOWO2_12_FULL_68_20]